MDVVTVSSPTGFWRMFWSSQVGRCVVGILAEPDSTNSDLVESFFLSLWRRQTLTNTYFFIFYVMMQIVDHWLPALTVKPLQNSPKSGGMPAKKRALTWFHFSLLCSGSLLLVLHGTHVTDYCLSGLWACRWQMTQSAFCSSEVTVRTGVWIVVWLVTCPSETPPLQPLRPWTQRDEADNGRRDGLWKKRKQKLCWNKLNENSPTWYKWSQQDVINWFYSNIKGTICVTMWLCCFKMFVQIHQSHTIMQTNYQIEPMEFAWIGMAILDLHNGGFSVKKGCLMAKLSGENIQNIMYIFLGGPFLKGQFTPKSKNTYPILVAECLL